MLCQPVKYKYKTEVLCLPKEYDTYRTWPVGGLVLCQPMKYKYKTEVVCLPKEYIYICTCM